jgi:putative copper export protein
VSAAALGVAALGALLLLARQPSLSTRFDRVTLAGAIAAAVVAAAMAASTRVRVLRLPADVCAVALLALPTLDGHAVARGPSHLLSVPSDLVHLLGAAVWTGGVLSLVALVPVGERRQATRRFGPLAGGAVVAIAVTGVLRAVGELRSVSQLWSTSYGQAILVKSVLFLAVVALAAVARGRPGRRTLSLESVLLFGLVATVAVLVGLRPGRDVSVVVAPALPSFVTAGEAGTYAIGASLSQDANGIRVRATVLGDEGPVTGKQVELSVSGRTAPVTSCGDGCYESVVPVTVPRSLRVRVGGESATLVVPQEWPAPSATPIVVQATKRFRTARGVVFTSRLASSPTNATTTLWKMAPPNLLSGLERGTGAGEVIIGNRRWDRDSANEAWVESPQSPIGQPAPPWPGDVRDAHFVGSSVVRGRPVWVVTFYDPLTPAWFRIAVDKRNSVTYSMNMIATAHFMREDYRDFGKPLAIVPPR